MHYTPASLAKLWSVSPRTIYDLCAKGLLEHSRVGAGRRIIRISQAAADRYMNSRTVAAKDPVQASAPKVDWRAQLREAMKPL